MTPEDALKQLKQLVLHARFADGERLARQIRDEATREKNLELAADATFFLGECCFEQLRYQDAWDAFADTLADRTELYGPNDLRTTQVRAWLAGVSISLQRSAETRSFLERAKSGVMKTPGDDERLVAADTLKAIGFVDIRLHNTNSAVEHLRRSLEFVESAKDAEELDIAAVCVILGMAEQAANHTRRAEELYQRALDIRTALLGEDNPLVAYCRNHLGIVKMLHGNREDAQELVNASIAELEATQDDRRSRASLSPHDAIDALEEDHTKAISTLEKAMLMKGGTEEETPEVAQTLVMLGLIQLGLEKPDLAETHLRRAVKILLPFHQTELDTLFKAFNNTLMALNAQRKFKDILAFAEPILDKLQNDATVDPGLLAAVMAGMSTGHYGLKKYTKAEKSLRRALGVIESRLGPDARELEPILQNMAQLLEEMGRRAEARTYAQRCEEIQAKYN